MALKGINITLVASTAAPLLVLGSSAGQLKNVSGTIQDPLPIIIVNNDAAAIVYIGGPDVTATTGIPLAAGASIPMSLYGGDTPYAFSTGTPIVSVLAGRQ